MFFLITGSRDFPTQEAWFIYRELDKLLKENPNLTMINGGAKGADTICLRWAGMRGVPTEVYKANWTKHHKAAGPIRNREMIARLKQTEGTVVMAFVYGKLYDSRGTKNCVDQAIKAGFTPNVYEHTADV
jgi:YspA, cpYpsA-related SLOG family